VEKYRRTRKHESNQTTNNNNQQEPASDKLNNKEATRTKTKENVVNRYVSQQPKATS